VRIQLISDLHLETEAFEPRPAPQAELLVLAGDIDSDWTGLSHFQNWPVPVIMVAGNHEFDHRELTQAWPQLRQHCQALGITLLEQQTTVITSTQGRRIRFLGTIRWCDFDAFGPTGQTKALRAGGYFAKVMQATHQGQPLDAPAVRQQALACRAWLVQALSEDTKKHDATVVITHFAPSLRSADPRYGTQPTTASFCNADDDLLPQANLWIHGHLHCRQDYWVGQTRIVCNARGHSHRGEADTYNGELVLTV
jgi:predicted phosphodiesterase